MPKNSQSRDKNSYGLTPIVEEFCHQYLKCNFDGKAAAIAAGSTAKNPAQVAYGWLQLPEVKQRIEQLKADRLKRIDVDADYVLRRLVEIDQMDVLDIMNDDMGFKPVPEWPPVWRQFISALDLAELKEGYGDEREMVGMLKKIKWPDKIKNLEMLGKHVAVQAFRERVTHDGDVSASLDDDGVQEVSNRVAQLLGRGTTVTH
jgi:phage terminase small subunit